MLKSIFKTKRRCIYIAEIGLNHNGDISTAIQMIEAAAGAGADAVKFQAFTPEKMNSVYTASLLQNGSEADPDTGIVDFFRKLTFTPAQFKKLKDKADGLGIVFFTSVFDEDSLAMTEALGVKLYKVASSEVTNHSLLKKIAATGKPVICSTGISFAKEIESAVKILKGSGSELVLMHCVSLYPPRPEDLNLKRILSLGKRFGVEVGYSDHNREPLSCALAAACGAGIFEKHFTLSDDFDCPDKAVSLPPERFSEMIELCETSAAMAGDGTIDFGEAESSTAVSARRSLFAARPVKAGAVIKDDDIIALRPGIGMPEYMRGSIVGRKSSRDIKKDYLLREEYFED